MATNVVSVNVYQINSQPPYTTPVTMAFPVANCILRDTSASPTRLLSTGISVYSAIQNLPTGANSQANLYYCVETLASLVSLFNS